MVQPKTQQPGEGIQGPSETLLMVHQAEQQFKDEINRLAKKAHETGDREALDRCLKIGEQMNWRLIREEPVEGPLTGLSAPRLREGAPIRGDSDPLPDKADSPGRRLGINGYDALRQEINSLDEWAARLKGLIGVCDRATTRQALLDGLLQLYWELHGVPGQPGAGDLLRSHDPARFNQVGEALFSALSEGFGLHKHDPQSLYSYPGGRYEAKKFVEPVNGSWGRNGELKEVFRLGLFTQGEDGQVWVKAVASYE